MSRFEIVNIEQGSDLWLKFRQSKITASQVPILFSESPYQNLYDLLAEKIIGTKPETNTYKLALYEKGFAAERAGRLYAKEHYGIDLNPAVVVSLMHKHLMASLDGFSDDRKTIFEAKYMGKEKLSLVKTGIIPKHHDIQIQAQLLVSGAEKCIYFATDPEGESAIAEISPDIALFEEIAIKAAKFMDVVGFIKSGSKQKRVRS